MKKVACFDIGGTFIKYGLLDETGNIIFKSKFETPHGNCRVRIPEEISNKIYELKKIDDINCIGISTAGQVDSDKGEIIYASDNIPDYTGTKLSYDLEKLIGLKCHIENDVNSAALGEMWKGNVHSKNFFFMTLGTGIGGAIIIDGKLYKGTGGSAGEAGHMILNEDGIPCTCGGNGCFERYASVTSLIRNYCEITNKSPNEANGEIIMNLVDNKDEYALKAYTNFVNHIVNGIMSITYILDPGIIVIGGGISEQKKLIQDINAQFKRKAMPSYSSHTEILSSTLKNDAGLLGACYVGLNY